MLSFLAYGNTIVMTEQAVEQSVELSVMWDPLWNDCDIKASIAEVELCMP